MDEENYHTTYQQLNTRPCIYSKAVFSRYFRCSHAENFYLADRIGISCSNTDAWQCCQVLHTHLQEIAHFALKRTPLASNESLPHAQELKLQIGGLLGIQKVLIAAQHIDDMPDIQQLLQQAQQQFGDLQRLPYNQIVRSITVFQPRRKRDK